MTIFNKKFNAQRSADRQTKRTGEPHIIESVTGGGFMVVLASTALPEPTADIVADLTAKLAAQQEAEAIEAPAEVERDGWMQVDTSVLAEEVTAYAPIRRVAGGARALVIEACSRPEGATAAELYTATTWKKTSWRFHLSLAGKATGCAPVIRKVDGTMRYFLIGG